MSEISLIDARSNSLTVTWPETAGCSQYNLEYRTTDEESFTVLSESLKSSQARKKNLTSEHAYIFKVTPILSSASNAASSITHSEAFRPLSAEAEAKAMDAPKTTQPDYNQSLVISWQKVDGASGYELQMRENVGGAPWKQLAASLSGLEVRKKNLTHKAGYQFRVRPVGIEEAPFSPPSEATVAHALSPGIRRWFQALDNGTLIRKGVSKPLPLEEALGGKEFVLLYASAHWCGPCRQFTPMLANWYQQLKGEYAEVVFLSADHDESGFRSYFQGSHPWLAVDFEDDARENLMGAIRTTGIPRLVVLSGRTGKIIEDNAVGKQLDINAWRNHPNHKL